MRVYLFLKELLLLPTSGSSFLSYLSIRHRIHSYSRAINRDPETYPNPHVFDPLRFLEHKQREAKAAFGFGRRICPGMGLAEASMFLQIIQTLAVFKLERVRDMHGHEIVPPAIWEDGTIRFVPSQSPRIVMRLSDGLSSP